MNNALRLKHTKKKLKRYNEDGKESENKSDESYDFDQEEEFKRHGSALEDEGLADWTL